MYVHRRLHQNSTDTSAATIYSLFLSPTFDLFGDNSFLFKFKNSLINFIINDCSRYETSREMRKNLRFSTLVTLFALKFVIIS